MAMLKVTLCQHIFTLVLSGEEKCRTLKSGDASKHDTKMPTNSKHVIASGQFNKAFS